MEVIRKFQLNIFLLFVMPITVIAQPGTLDNTFGTNGKVTSTFGDYFSAASAVALQSDGKIIVAGTHHNGTDNDFAIVRYNNNGSLDNTFGTGGKVLLGLGVMYEDYAKSIAIQSDGKIVVAGYTFNTLNNNFALVRLNSNGALDNTFGTNGIVMTDYLNCDNYGHSVRIQTDGKILLTGYISYSSKEYVTTLRYNNNGSLDRTFGANKDGIVATTIGTNSNARANSLAIQADGKIIVAGYILYGGIEYILTVRYANDGILDNTFGTYGGANVTSIENIDCIGYSVAIQNDGKIIVAGGTDGAFVNGFAMVRFHANGNLDSTFGKYGCVNSNTGKIEVGKAVAIQNDGKILVAGYSGDANDVNVALFRYDSIGSFDNSFGSGGRVISDISSFDDYGSAMAIANDGRIVVAGYSMNVGSSTRLGDIILARYNINNSSNVYETISSPHLVSIFPNPSTGTFTLDNKSNEDYQIQVFDLNGKIVDTFYMNSNSQQVMHYEKHLRGIYFIHIIGVYLNQIEKIVLLD